MGSNEDDFWNQSSSSRLNFFDEEDVGVEVLLM
jgi:hypothetical protein